MENLPCTLEHDCLTLLGGTPSIEAVRELEAHLLALPQVDMAITHVVHGGMCARTMLIPAGVALTGALTNVDNTCIVCGDITVTTDDGPQRLTGYHILPAKSGAKRAGIAHADTWWTTIHRTDLMSIYDIEDEMTNESAGLGSRRQLIADGVTQ